MAVTKPAASQTGDDVTATVQSAKPATTLTGNTIATILPLPVVLKVCSEKLAEPATNLNGEGDCTAPTLEPTSTPTEDNATAVIPPVANLSSERNLDTSETKASLTGDSHEAADEYAQISNVDQTTVAVQSTAAWTGDNSIAIVQPTTTSTDENVVPIIQLPAISVNSRKALTEFTRFVDLPLELQTKVWKWACKGESIKVLTVREDLGAVYGCETSTVEIRNENVQVAEEHY